MYTTVGMINGRCNHKHKTLEEAVRCLIKYRNQQPLSDRTVRSIGSDGKPQLLGVEETVAVNQIHDRLVKKG